MYTSIDVGREVRAPHGACNVARLSHTVEFVELIDDPNGTGDTEDTSSSWGCCVSAKGHYK